MVRAKAHVSHVSQQAGLPLIRQRLIRQLTFDLDPYTCTAAPPIRSARRAAFRI